MFKCDICGKHIECDEVCIICYTFLEKQVSQLQDENERLKELILSAKDGLTYIGSVYSGCSTSKKVERLLYKALVVFQPLRKWINTYNEALKGGVK